MDYAHFAESGVTTPLALSPVARMIAAHPALSILTSQRMRRAPARAAAVEPREPRRTDR